MRPLTLILSIALLVAGCAAPPVKQAMTYLPNEKVVFGGFEFALISDKKYNYIPTNNPSIQKAPGTKWVVLEVSMMNLDNKPVEFSFHPTFKLRSASGAEYAEDTAMSTVSNSAWGYSQMQPLNPMVAVSRRAIFQVPPGAYSLEVFTPSRVVSNLVSTKTYGERFFYQISNVN